MHVHILYSTIIILYLHLFKGNTDNINTIDLFSTQISKNISIYTKDILHYNTHSNKMVYIHVFNDTLQISQIRTSFDSIVNTQSTLSNGQNFSIGRQISFVSIDDQYIYLAHNQTLYLLSYSESLKDEQYEIREIRGKISHIEKRNYYLLVSHDGGKRHLLYNLLTNTSIQISICENIHSVVPHNDKYAAICFYVSGMNVTYSLKIFEVAGLGSMREDKMRITFSLDLTNPERHAHEDSIRGKDSIFAFSHQYTNALILVYNQRITCIHTDRQYSDTYFSSTISTSIVSPSQVSCIHSTFHIHHSKNGRHSVSSFSFSHTDRTFSHSHTNFLPQLVYKAVAVHQSERYFYVYSLDDSTGLGVHHLVSQTPYHHSVDSVVIFIGIYMRYWVFSYFVSYIVWVVASSIQRLVKKKGEGKGVSVFSAMFQSEPVEEIYRKREEIRGRIRKLDPCVFFNNVVS